MDLESVYGNMVVFLMIFRRQELLCCIKVKGIKTTVSDTEAGLYNILSLW